MSHIVVSTIATHYTVWSYLTMRTSVFYRFTTTHMAWSISSKQRHILFTN
jgi:hypothetical protein